MYPKGYNVSTRYHCDLFMYTIEQPPEFEAWFNGLRDHTIKIRLLARLARVENGNFGDYKTVEGR